MMDRITHELAHPIVLQVHDGASAKTVTIDKLELAPRIKGRHMRATDHAQGPVEAKLLLISSLAGISRAEADELDEVDIIAIDSFMGGEASDLQRVSTALGLRPGAAIADILAAISDRAPSPGQTAGEESATVSAVPLDAGAGLSADGPAIGAPSPQT